MGIYLGKNYNYLVLDVIQAAAADVQLKGGVINFGDPLQIVCDYKNLIVGKCSVTTAVAQTNQVSTLTFTAANNTEYGISIDWWDPTLDKTVRKVYYYTSDATATATEIANAFAAAITADPTSKVTAVGGATLVITATAGYPFFNVNNIAEGTTVAGTTTPTTPGVAAIGTQAALAAKGITVANATYTTVHMEYNMNMNPVNAVATLEPYVLDIYLNDGDANEAALSTAFNDIFKADDGAGAVPLDAVAVS